MLSELESEVVKDVLEEFVDVEFEWMIPPEQVEELRWNVEGGGGGEGEQFVTSGAVEAELGGEFFL